MTARDALREEVIASIRATIKCDATGLSPAVASVFLIGIEDAADRILSLPAIAGALGGEAWQDLTCDDQFALAGRIAANVGYVLTEEPDHPDSPHNRLAAPAKGEEPVWHRFNVNHEVEFRLTDHGRAVHRAFWEPYSAGKYRAPEVDADGWSRFQLWDAMAVFGPHLSMTGSNPFETTIRLPVAAEPDRLAVAVEALERAKAVLDNTAVSNDLRILGSCHIIESALAALRGGGE